MSGGDPTVPGEQRGRQAVASLGGYAHQLLTTIAAWMRLAPGQALLVEVAEDYAVVAEGALTMTQVKREGAGAALTLRREDARKAIASLWQFGEANPGTDVRLHFLTTAPATQERGAAFPDGLNGTAYWTRVALGADVEPLRTFLATLDLPADLAAFIADADAEALRSRLLRRIAWLTGSDATQVLIDSLGERLAALAVARGMMPTDGERALPALLLRVLQTLFEADRRLTPEQFETAWERATTIPVPLSAVRRMLGQTGGAMRPRRRTSSPDRCRPGSPDASNSSTASPASPRPARCRGSTGAAASASPGSRTSSRTGRTARGTSSGCAD